MDYKQPTIIDAILGVKIVKARAGGWHTVLLASKLKNTQENLTFLNNLIFSVGTGDLYVFGWNNKGQLGFKTISETSHQDPEPSSHISVGMLHTPTLLELEQYLATTEYVVVSNVDCGTTHTAAVTKNGNVLTWGTGKYAQLGHHCCMGAMNDTITMLRLNPQQISCMETAHLPKVVSLSQNFNATSVKCGPWNTYVKYI